MQFFGSKFGQFHFYYYICSELFEKSKKKANNIMSGRIAQNYRKIKTKNCKKNWTIFL